MALILQIVCVAIIFETRHEHVYQSIPFETVPSKESDEFKQVDRSIKFICYLFWLLALVEFIIIFNGMTMFNNQWNLAMIFIHFACIGILLNFKTKKSHVDDFLGVLFTAG